MTLEERIETAQNSLAAATTDEQRYLLGLGIQKLKDLLEQQKKSESQKLAKHEHLPTKTEMQEWASKEEQAKYVHVESEYKQPDSITYMTQGEGIKTIENRVVVGRASENVVTIPVAEVKVGGQYRQLTQTEIIGWLKTYFKRVACRMAEDGKYTEAYASKMGQDVWRLFDGWNLIYRETNEGTAYPPMTDIFPGWKNASQAQKVSADVLWRWAANDK